MVRFTKLFAVALVIASTSAAKADFSISEFFNGPKQPMVSSVVTPTSDCVRSASKVKADTHAKWAKYTLRKRDHEGERCWYATRMPSSEHSSVKKESKSHTAYIRDIGKSKIGLEGGKLKDRQEGKDLLNSMFGPSEHKEY